MRKSFSKGMFFLLLAAIAATGTETLAQESDAELLDRVKAIWKKREESIKSFRIELSETYVRGKDTILLSGSLAKELEYKRSQVLTVDGTNIRKQQEGAGWATKISATTPRTDIEVLNDKEYRELMRYDEGDGTVVVVGWIRKPELILANTYVRQIMVHFRPSTSGTNLDHLKIIKRDVNIDDDTCIVLEDPDALGDKIKWTTVRRLYYVSPEKEMAIRRYEQYVGGELHYYIDTDYQRDEMHGWVPEKISGRCHMSKRFFDSCKSVVTKAEFNIPIPAETFTLDFPEGAEVRDHRARKQTP